MSSNNGNGNGRLPQGARFGLGTDLYSCGQVAALCRVAPRTVQAWFDRGVLKGYRIPHSQHRRIPRAALIDFLRESGMTAALASLGEQPDACLLAGLPRALEWRLHELLLPSVPLRVARTLFELGCTLHSSPALAVVDLAIGPRDEVRAALSRLVEDCKRVVVLMPEDAPSVLGVAFTGEGWENVRLLQHPASAEAVAGALQGEEASR